MQRMEETATSAADAEMPAVQPLPPNIRCIQPGGGTILALELAWGRWRRAFLKRYFPRYVATMRRRLKGDAATCPVEVIDSRDLKFFTNVTDCHFDLHDDPFHWRDRLPLARAGFAELLLFGVVPLIAAISVALLAPGGWKGMALLPGLLGAFSFYFFRDPHRQIPQVAGGVVSPADGKVVEMTEVPDPTGGTEPYLKIGIFLSVFNCHVNRAPLRGKVVAVAYYPGKFLNALWARSAEENERTEITFVEPERPHRRFVVRQIAGAIARRIVCAARPGSILERGERFGMIKFGSRTELLLPKAGFVLETAVGAGVRGGATLLGRYAEDGSA